MQFVEVTLDSVAENLALEDALLQSAESGDRTEEVLRIWHAKSRFVVLGRSSKAEAEVEIERARSAQLPVFRRASGGATVLAAPGCMFYAVVLSLQARPQLRMLDEAHRFVMGKVLSSVRPLCPSAALDGTCDLVVDGRKASGNSLKVQRNWLLYHGTLLLNMDLSLLDQFLKHPPREPDYRQGRSHRDFVTNMQISADQLTGQLRECWAAKERLQCLPLEAIRDLVERKYGNHEWNFER